MDSCDRFIETSLLSKEAIYNKVRGHAFSDDEYAHAQKGWSTFGCNTILDYHNIYLKFMDLHISLITPTHPSADHVAKIFSAFSLHKLLPTISTQSSCLFFKAMYSS